MGHNSTHLLFASELCCVLPTLCSSFLFFCSFLSVMPASGSETQTGWSSLSRFMTPTKGALRHQPGGALAEGPHPSKGPFG